MNCTSLDSKPDPALLRINSRKQYFPPSRNLPTEVSELLKLYDQTPNPNGGTLPSITVKPISIPPLISVSAMSGVTKTAKNDVKLEMDCSISMPRMEDFNSKAKAAKRALENPKPTKSSPPKYRRLNKAERIAAAEKRQALKEQREKEAIQKKLEREEKKREIAERKARFLAVREARKIEAERKKHAGAFAIIPRLSSPKLKKSQDKENEKITEDEISDLSSTGTSGSQSFQLADNDERVNWKVLDYGFNPISFAQLHQCGLIDTYKPWSVEDLEIYYDYIDSRIMDPLYQNLIWKRMIPYKVPLEDPGLHPVGTLECCTSNLECPVIIRAKNCFFMRAKLLYLFMYPYMKKYGWMLESIIGKVWTNVSNEWKEMFYRDVSKIGIYHEYITMLINYPPTAQEKNIFYKCYPGGIRVKPRPSANKVLISCFAYAHFNGK